VPDALRPLRDTAAELDRADELLTIAYGTTSRRRLLELYLAAQPDGWFVIEREGELVAIAGCLSYGTFCWLGLVGTHPATRGQGLATRISEHMVEWSRARGCATIALDASDLGQPVYERLGFQTVGFTAELSGAPVDGPQAPREDDVDVDELLALDAAAFGADRSALLRRFAHGHRDGAAVLRDGAGRATGYLFAGERLIGPGLAPDADGAAQLVRALLALPGERRLQVPAESAFHETLLGLGMVEQRRLAHMRLGDLTLPGRRDLLVAQLSFATG
jgi:GNAT superfamily N-acetyltransferase